MAKIAVVRKHTPMLIKGVKKEDASWHHIKKKGGKKKSK